MALLYCAKKYILLGLQAMCQDFLEKQLDSSNVCFILEQVGTMLGVFSN